MTAADYTGHYWLHAELIAFARRLGLSTYGSKPALSARIERRLRGRPDRPVPRRAPSGPRDSERPLRRDRPVVHYKSDDRTRAFFVAAIGPEFHFTYHLNQFRLARSGLTYGDLIDEWLAERQRRQRGDYQARIAAHGRWNRFVRDFFADPANAGRSLREAAALWNLIKHRRGEPRYRPRRRAGR